jgi:hypothetical protein
MPATPEFVTYGRYALGVGFVAVLVARYIPVVLDAARKASTKMVMTAVLIG